MSKILYSILFACLIITAKIFGQGIIINEIMYNSLPGEAEWIEVYNPGKNSINIQGWKIGDKNKPGGAVITDDTYIIFPDDYVVIRSNSGLFFDSEAGTNEIIMESGFPKLNNDEDDIILRDSSDTAIDSIRYTEKWGGEKGASLERINPLKDGNDKDNWGTNVTGKGSSAGKENSIYSIGAPNSVSINVSPNPFSPDGDGIDDAAIISYSLPFEYGTIRLEIYDAAGRLVRRLLNNENTGSSRSVNWDGKNNDGKTLPIGIYILYLEAMKAEKGIKVSKKAAVVLAGQL
ncbi:lamin tail domain-containing protein, partial [bacterium]|nr:lamin tail domain-containing protein [bacterium]